MALFARAALRDSGQHTSTLWITGEKASGRAAAFCNSVAASAVDFDSVHIGAAVHPDIVNVPISLAIGESTRRSDKDALTAITLASDLLCRLALSSRANLRLGT